MARNARLAALRTFARFLVADHPEQMITLRNVLGTPFKHGAKDGWRRSSTCSRRTSKRLRTESIAAPCAFVRAPCATPRPPAQGRVHFAIIWSMVGTLTL